MRDSSSLLDLFAVVAPGLEAITATELSRLGVRHAARERGGLQWRGNVASMQRANLMLRTASRVLGRVAQFHASSFHELERRARRVPWERWLTPGRPVQFRVTAHKSRLYHSDAVAERLYAVVAAITGSNAVLHGDAVALADGDPMVAGPQLFVVRIAHDMMTISADSSGALLHRRGYRQAVGKAPLRETIAAAMLLAVGYDGETALLDPMCGSGTIAIEGALIARRIPPGSERTFSFTAWPTFDAAAWHTVRDEAMSAVRAHAPAPIVASDRDAGAVTAAASNAARADVAANVEIVQRPLSALAAPAARGGAVGGWVITNPPYGVRVGADVRNLYARLGQLARAQLEGWRMGVLTSDPRGALARQLGIPLERAFRTENGGIPVEYLVSGIPATSVAPAPTEQGNADGE